MSNLLQLAERCEQATAQEQHDLICDAWIAVFGAKTNWHPFIDILATGGFLDAALTLVPDGHKWCVFGGGYASVEQWNGTDGDEECDCDGQTRCATPALALCAAALRALAASGMEARQGEDGTASSRSDDSPAPAGGDAQP